MKKIIILTISGTGIVLLGLAVYFIFKRKK